MLGPSARRPGLASAVLSLGHFKPQPSSGHPFGPVLAQLRGLPPQAARRDAIERLRQRFSLLVRHSSFRWGVPQWRWDAKQHRGKLPPRSRDVSGLDLQQGPNERSVVLHRWRAAVLGRQEARGPRRSDHVGHPRCLLVFFFFVLVSFSELQQQRRCERRGLGWCLWRRCVRSHLHALRRCRGCLEGQCSRI